jgi:hypothetical protein
MIYYLKVQWAKPFIEAQGHQVKANKYHDNQSSMQLENNGRIRSGKEQDTLTLEFFHYRFDPKKNDQD